MNGTSRNVFLDCVKSFTIILMVFCHCIQFGSGRDYYTNMLFFDNYIFKIVYSFHMPIFMIVSGYLFAYSVKNNDRENSWMYWLVKKGRQLLLPLFSWSFISLLISILKKLLSGEGQEISAKWIIRRIAHAFISGPWFLWALWWSSLVVIIICYFFHDLLVAYLLVAIISFITPDGANMHLYKFMFPFYVIGYMAGKREIITVWKNLNKKKFVVTVYVLFFILIMFYKRDIYIYISGFTLIGKNAITQICIDIFRFFVGLVGSIAGFVLFYFASNKLRGKVRCGINYLGRNTLGIYIISGYLVTEVLYVITIGVTGLNYFLTIIETAAIVLTSLMFVQIIKSFRCTNILFLGGR